MSDDRNLRVIFQGGGARLGILLAAADALERISSSAGHLKLVHIGGVSAGSIAAAALASRRPVLEFREKLASIAEPFVDAFQSEYDQLHRLTEPEVLDLFQDIIASFRKSPGIFGKMALGARLEKVAKDRGRALSKILDMRDGHPLYSFENVEGALHSLFGDDKFSDLKIGLTVFTTKLLSLKRHSYSDPNMPLYKALALSCAMPGVFRSFRNLDKEPISSDGDGHYEYDGGLSGNLPVSSFDNIDAASTKTLCIAFPAPKIEINNALDFARALLTCAMQSSVQEAKLQTTETGGVVCELPDLEIGTFDFGKALRQQLDRSDFENLSHRIEGLLKPKIDQLFEQSGYAVVRKSQFRNDDVAMIFDQLYGQFPVRKKNSVRLYIHGRSIPSKATDPVPQDERFLVDYFEPVNGAMSLFAMPLPTSSVGEVPKIDSLTIQIQDAANNPVQYRAYLHQEEEGQKIKSRILVFLGELIASDRCPLKVSVLYEGDPFPAFKAGSRTWDYIRTTCVTPGGITDTTWIVVWPKRVGALRISELSTIADERLAAIADESGRPADFGTQWVHGAAISARAAEEIVTSVYGSNRVENCEFYGFNVGAMLPQQASGLLIEQV